MHQSQIEQFQQAWTKKYVQLLMLKRDAISELLKFRREKDENGENIALNNLTTINLEIELAVTEHDIMTNSFRDKEYPNNDVN